MSARPRAGPVRPLGLLADGRLCLQRLGTNAAELNLRWEAYTSWAHFSWLYLLSAVSALRSALFFKLGVDGWETWIIGAGILLACAAILRHWAHYELTDDQVTVRNGYTGREIQSIPLSDVGHVDIQQGIVADFFGIGTVLSTEPLVSLPVCCRGRIGSPSLGIDFGPPAPLPGPMLLVSELPVRTSISCTEIGASLADLTTVSAAVRSASRSNRPWKTNDCNKNGLRKSDSKPASSLDEES